MTPIPVPNAPVLNQEGNLLSIFNPAILPDSYSLRWFQEDNLLDHTAFALCISETGKYGIELTNSTSGCNNFFESVYSFEENGICSTPTEDLSKKIEKVTIYPNPVQEQLTIDLTFDKPLENAVISISNILGQQLAYEFIAPNTIEQQIQFDMANYLPGMYVVQLRDGDKVSSWKVLKQ